MDDVERSKSRQEAFHALLGIMRLSASLSGYIEPDGRTAAAYSKVD